MTWFDERISWDPSLYDGMITMLFQDSDIWFPKLSVSNSYSIDNSQTNNDITVRLYANGYCLLSRIVVYEATCPIDVKYYPFDTQVC